MRKNDCDKVMAQSKSRQIYLTYKNNNQALASCQLREK